VWGLVPSTDTAHVNWCTHLRASLRSLNIVECVPDTTRGVWRFRKVDGFVPQTQRVDLGGNDLHAGPVSGGHARSRVGIEARRFADTAHVNWRAHLRASLHSLNIVECVPGV